MPTKDYHEQVEVDSVIEIRGKLETGPTYARLMGESGRRKQEKRGQLGAMGRREGLQQKKEKESDKYQIVRENSTFSV